MNTQNKRGRDDLDKTLKLLALVAVRDMTLKEQVSLLSRAGYDRNEIAELLGTSPNSVSVRLNELKKEARAKKRSGKKGAQ